MIVSFFLLSFLINFSSISFCNPAQSSFTIYHFVPQIILCTFCPFLIFPLIYFVPDEQHEREAAARLSQKGLYSKSMKNIRRPSITGETVELQKVKNVRNGNPKTNLDEESKVGEEEDIVEDIVEEIVEHIPGKEPLNSDSPNQSLYESSDSIVRIKNFIKYLVH